MAKKTITLKIDVSKIDKDKLYVGAKGTYLDAVLFLDDDADQYQNNGMVIQSVTQEDRKNGVRGAILGNAKIVGNSSGGGAPSAAAKDDLPF